MEFTATWREIVEKNGTPAEQPHEWMVWHGRQNQRQAQQGQRQTRQKQGKGKGKLGKGKSKSKAKGKKHGKKGQKLFHEMKGHEDKQETQTSQEHTEWTYTSWDHADNWIDAGWWSNDWSTDLWTDPAWEQAARQLPSTQPAQEQSNPTHGGSISTLGGLTMCELSVDDGEEQNEQDEVDRNRCDNWSWYRNWIQSKPMDGHKSWNNRIDHRKWIQCKMTDGYENWNNSWNTSW